MLLKEAIDKYGNYQVDEDKLKEILKPQGKYIPRVNEHYFYIEKYGEIFETKNDYEEDEYLIKHHLVFRTRKECEEYRSFIALLDIYTFEPDWNDRNQEKWFISYNSKTDEFNYRYNTIIVTGLHNFKSEEQMNEFIKLAGKENVKKFMFDIWE